MCILPHVSFYLCAADDFRFWVWKKELEIAVTSKFGSPRDDTQMPLNDNAARPSRMHEMIRLVLRRWDKDGLLV